MPNDTETPPAVSISPPQPASAQLKQILLDRIASGVYAPGSRLPSIRETASCFRINRNTVSKVYRELAQEGITRTEGGIGVFVQKTPIAATQKSSWRSPVSDALYQLARRARLYGLSRSAFSDLVTQALDNVYRPRSIAFVECNANDAVALANDLGIYLGERVCPVVLADLRHHPRSIARKYDLICTTLYHVAEINEAMPGPKQKIVAIQVTPRPEVLLQLTQFTARQCLGIVASNERTRDAVIRIVNTYCPASIDPIIISDTLKKLAFSRPVDAVVDTLATHKAVERWVKNVPHITITYHADNQSLEEIRRRLLE